MGTFSKMASKLQKIAFWLDYFCLCMQMDAFDLYTSCGKERENNQYSTNILRYCQAKEATKIAF